MPEVEEQSRQTNKVWFPAKSYGWGWGIPKAWQGWVVLLGCLLIGLAPIIYVANWYKGDTYCQEILDKHINVSCDPDRATSLYLLGSFMWLTAWVLVLIMVSSKKGEKPSWRWGSKKNNAKKSKSH